MSSTLGRILYDAMADAVENKKVSSTTSSSWSQLASSGNTLRAPEGQFEDRASAFALAIVARPERPLAGGRPQPSNRMRTPTCRQR